MAVAAVRLHLQPSEALTLTPGMFSDMLALITPAEEKREEVTIDGDTYDCD